VSLRFFCIGAIMQRFPRLAFASNAWRLPLTDQTANALCGCLTASDAATTNSPLEHALLQDPVLVTWCALRARETDNVTFGCIHDLSDWLAPNRLLDLLQWNDVSDAAPLAAADTVLLAWKSNAAVASRFLTSLKNDLAADRSFYRRTLSCGAKWLSTCCERPAGLADHANVADVVQRLTDIGVSVLAADIVEPNAVSRTCEPTRRDHVNARWSNTQLLAPLLPALVERLRRLHVFEHDFTNQLEQAKLLAMKELAYGAGHEINNPLANISARAQTLLVDERDPERRRKLASINRQAFRAHEMIADMMLYAKPPRLSRTPLEIVQIIDDVILGLEDRADERNVKIKRDVVGPLPKIEADATQLAVALTAICQNSLEAIEEQGTITVSAEVLGLRPHQRAVTVRVQDTGPGIPAAIRQHIFDPFYSGREAGRGLGFGLSKAWRIVQAHGGHIDVENVPGSGTVFTMRVPTQAD
jgi:signal transduction histidine kinase